MKYVALYVRVSTEEQKNQGLSVDNQIDSLAKFCEANNMKYKVFNDAGISAHKSYKKRPALLDLIEECQKGNVSLILFTRLDRWFRSVKDYYLVLDQLNGVPWRAIWEDYETETSSGQLKVNIMLSVAEAEASRTSEKVKAVMQFKREKGEYYGHVPFGFKLVNKRLEIDEETKEACREMFDVYLRTGSSYKVADFLKPYLPKINSSGARDRLKNKLYIGTYITPEEHDFILQQFKKHFTPAKNKFVHLFSCLIKCPTCGCTLQANNVYRKTKTGEERVHHYYKCPNFCCNVSENAVESQLMDYLDRMIGSKEIKAEIRQIESQKKDIASVEKKIERLKDLYIDGDISKKDYTEKKEALERQKKELQQAKSPVLPTLPSNWKEIYSELTDEGKKAFWQRIINHIDVSDKANIKPFFN